MTIAQEKFYIVVPKAATNLITNPSAELGTTTGWTASAGSSIASVATHQRRGARAFEMTPANGSVSRVVYELSLSTGLHTFSADILGVSGQSMSIYVADSVGSALSTTSFTANGYWQRKSVTYTVTTAGTYRLYISRASYASTAKFYFDGCLLETGAESTYFDGDNVGLTTDKDFGWNGTPHASTSYRLARTRAGGTLLDISSYARILGHIGLSRAPEEHTESDINADGELWRAVKVQGRPFSLLLAFGQADWAARMAARKTLLAALQLDKTPIRQPVVLRYVGVDATGEWATEPLDIVCTYRGGLEGDWTATGQYKAAVQFRMASPYMRLDGHAGTALGYATNISNANCIVMQDTDGTWKAMGTGVNGVVYCMKRGLDGAVYVGGAFRSAGVADTGGVAKWSEAAWSALGTGITSGTVYAMAIAPDGTLYIGGSFTVVGGVTVNHIAKWNGSTWSALDSGTNGDVNALEFDRSGNLWVGGAFTTVGASATSSPYFAKWTGAAWVAIGSNFNHAVTCMAVDSAGTIYIGGDFSSAGAWIDVAQVIKYTPPSGWSKLGSGLNETPRAMRIGSDGSLYVVGDFTAAGGDTANYVAKWNPSSSSWSTFGSGLNEKAYTIEFFSDGSFVVGGYFTTAGGITLPDRAAIYRNGAWSPLDINVNDTSANVYSILIAGDRLYIGGGWAGSTATSATVTVPNNTGAKAYPKITFTGPGAVWQCKNYTNGDAIYFKNLTLLAGETATLDCNPRKFSFVSSWRGNLQSYILQGSSNLSVEPGSNNISAYMTGTSAASAISAYWQPTFTTIEEALR